METIGYILRSFPRLSQTFILNEVLALEERGVRNRTAIAFLADHGEEFGEHGGYQHQTLYDEVARVPLILVAPSLAPARVAEPVQQADLLPTLLGLVRDHAFRESFVVEKNLDRLGAQGWELVAVIGSPSDPVYHLKRRK